jgi:UDPglucose--hexose-1-phosphate uridylyltransferase
MSKSAERRLNLLTGEWILISPQRLARPWQGAVGGVGKVPALHHAPDCYLCPGSVRAGGAHNPDYAGVHVFDNDFPALLPPLEGQAVPSDPLLVSAPESGACRVICYSPDHSRTMSQLPHEGIRAIVDVWAAQTQELEKRADIRAVTIFENKGTMMGASNPHPHGQIWATQSVPHLLGNEDEHQRRWLAAHGEPLLIAYLNRELDAKSRIVVQNDAFVALVPFWAAWPFETLVLPRRAAASLDQFDDATRDALADILLRLTAAYDALFDTPFPYSMGIHQRPRGTEDAGHFVCHIHFYPPLLRSASIRKFMVGFEMFAMPQRDLTPEEAAERLTALI